MEQHATDIRSTDEPLSDVHNHDRSAGLRARLDRAIERALADRRVVGTVVLAADITGELLWKPRGFLSRSAHGPEGVYIRRRWHGRNGGRCPEVPGNAAGRWTAATTNTERHVQGPGLCARTGRGKGWEFGFGGAVLVDPKATDTPQAPGTLQRNGAYGHKWFIDPANELTVVALTNTAFEGMVGRFTVEIRDAVYGQQHD